jgi:hypothetical protein
MIFGMIIGGIIWAASWSVFLVLPGALSFSLALIIGPLVTGYFGGRLGGRRAGYALTFVGTVIALALSTVYVPHISWEYPHNIWAGVSLFITLLVLGNAAFTVLGGVTGIQAREYSKLKQTESKTKVAGQRKDGFLRGTAPSLPDPLQVKITELLRKESDLQNDLATIEAKKGLDQISPTLLQERQNVLQIQLLDVVLEKERLIRESKRNVNEHRTQ